MLPVMSQLFDTLRRQGRAGMWHGKGHLTEGHWNLDRGTGTGRSAMGMLTLPPAGGRPFLRAISSTKVLVAATAAVQLLR